MFPGSSARYERGKEGSGFRVQGSGLRVQGSGFRVPGPGFRVQGPGLRVQGPGFRVQGPGFRVQGPGFRVQGPGCRVQDSGFRVQGSGFRVQGPGFRVQGPGFRVQGSGKEENVRLERTERTRPGPPSSRISGFRRGLWHPLPCWPGLTIRVVNQKLGCEGKAGGAVAGGGVWRMMVRCLENVERILVRRDVVKTVPPSPIGGHRNWGGGHRMDRKFGEVFSIPRRRGAHRRASGRCGPSFFPRDVGEGDQSNLGNPLVQRFDRGPCPPPRTPISAASISRVPPGKWLKIFL